MFCKITNNTELLNFQTPYTYNIQLLIKRRNRNIRVFNKKKRCKELEFYIVLIDFASIQPMLPLAILISHHWPT